MLTELTISNFAIIERQSLSFHSGFNVISGETGAGKSIILHALEFILGGKGSPSLIRSGAEQLEVQALFDLAAIPESVRAELPEIVGADEELVVSRTLPREGRSKVLINGRLGTVSLVEEIVRKIVNICSQHHQTKLLDSRFHLEMLDGFCGCSDLADKMIEAHRAWSGRRTELQRLKELHARSAERCEELEAALEDLSAVQGLKSGRRAELEREIKRVGNAEKLISVGQRATDLMSGDEGLALRVKELAGCIQEIARLDPGSAALLSEFEEARESLARSEISVSRFVNSLDLDADALEALREELSQIARLERKYRTDDAGLLALREQTQRELAALSGGDGLKDLEQEVARLLSQALLVGQELSRVRSAGAQQLCKAVARDLAEVNMRDSTLEVRFAETEPSAAGIDKVDFLISTNKGQPHAPLASIASGGELSRVMLVLKKILRERSGVNVLIFDEVDTGISGGVARSVGQMLKEISSRSQVVCITHLPQVASLSDRHFLVDKQVEDRAVTIVKQLSEDEKVDEIARMLAGYTITEAARASARELIGSK